ncbi:hypothetical protein [Bifidobacterium xylocopae]|uniref:Proteasomal ATPase N-terminal OB domain-containing protein n=1 Tax=Bifidobacterium xylocopae TaxID=2493119 RepID=A0A366KGW6_9BIFI|nr:hypothetical protein [Bifidobacterium xylocopae]RBP99931.1 hypothetical protein CRD59_00200 [Bifidobacterium xylocopae]
MTGPPLTCALLLGIASVSYEEGVQRARVELVDGARGMMVAVSPLLPVEGLRAGQTVLLDERMVVVAAREPPNSGPVRQVQRVDAPGRLLVKDQSVAYAWWSGLVTRWTSLSRWLTFYLSIRRACWPCS